MAKTVEIKSEVLNDLASRFLINIPDEDKDDPVKLCSHIELAHWFYLDLVRPDDPSLPACNMKEFMATIFKFCPFLVRGSVANDLDTLIQQWKSHKYTKPVRGAIILNEDWTKCLLVQGYPASTSWGFPKGKLEQGENDVDAAVREVYEETGFDSRNIIREDWYLEATVNSTDARMYIIPGVKDDTHFEPKTRNEIRAIEWFRIDDLPRHRKDATSVQAIGKRVNNFFMIIPFIGQLRKWVASHSKGRGVGRIPKGKTISASFQNSSPLQSRSQSQNQYQMQSVAQTHNSVPGATPTRKAIFPTPTHLVPSPSSEAHSHIQLYQQNVEQRMMAHGNLGMGPVHLGNETQYPARQMGPEPLRSFSDLRNSPQTSYSPVAARSNTTPIPYPPPSPHTPHYPHLLPAPLQQHGYNTMSYPTHIAFPNTAYQQGQGIHHPPVARATVHGYMINPLSTPPSNPQVSPGHRVPSPNYHSSSIQPQVHLQPAPSFVGFKFDRSAILIHSGFQP